MWRPINNDGGYVYNSNPLHHDLRRELLFHLYTILDVNDFRLKIIRSLPLPREANIQL